jgi:bacillithiol biosynthesis cysteine-adding enzyme BshC
VIGDPLALARQSELSNSRDTLERCLRRAAWLRDQSFPRVELADKLSRRLAELGAAAAAVDRARALREPQTICVVTGQQPGFLGGPLYTFLKAAHCIAVAQTLQKHWPGAVVPMFWVHSDDHDIDETRHTSLVDGRGQLVRIAADFGRGKPFLYDLRLGVDAAEKTRQCLELLPFGVDTEKVKELLSVREGERFAEQSCRMLLSLFGSRGLVVFEPRDLREELSHSLSRVVAGTGRALAELARSAQALRERGFAPAIGPDDPSIVYMASSGQRERIHYRGELYQLPDGRSLGPQALAAAILGDPGVFTAGVASRLVTECLTLPVVGVVRGPAEIAYAPLSACFMPEPLTPADVPVEFPRYSATLVPRRLVGGADVDGDVVAELVEGREPEGAEPIPPEDAALIARLGALRQSATETLMALEPALKGRDPNLARPFEKTRFTVENAIEQFSQRLEKSARDRANVAATRATRIRSWLRPSGKPQERVLPVAPFLCAGIDALVTAMIERAPFMPTAHEICIIEDAASSPQTP